MRDPNEYIDDIVKDGEGSSFQYKNAYWEEMASLLDANDLRKKRKAILLWTSSAASLLILVISSWAILGTDILYQERPDNEIASFSDNNVSFYMQQYQLIAENAVDEKGQASTLQNSNANNQNSLALATSNTSNESEDVDFVEEQNLSVEIADKISLEKMEVNTPALIDNDIDVAIAQTSQEFDFPEVEFNKISKHHLSADGGIGISGITNSEGSSITYHAGLTYSYDLNRNWSIQSGLKYFSQGTNLTKSETYSKYSFKRTDEQIHLSYDRLHYAQMPVGVSFTHKRSKVGLNITPSYVVGVETSYQHTKFDHDTQSFNTIAENNNNYGITDGINKFDLQLGLSYEYALTSYLNLGANVNMGTMDVTDNAYWGANSNDLNFNASAFLRFNLF